MSKTLFYSLESFELDDSQPEGLLNEETDGDSLMGEITEEVHTLEMYGVESIVDNQELDKLVKVQNSLEALADELKHTLSFGGIDGNSLNFVHTAMESYADMLGDQYQRYMLPSHESFNDKVTRLDSTAFALEGVLDTAKSVGKKIIQFIKDMWNKFTGWIKGFFNTSEKMEKETVLLLQAVETKNWEPDIEEVTIPDRFGYLNKKDVRSYMSEYETLYQKLTELSALRTEVYKKLHPNPQFNLWFVSAEGHKLAEDKGLFAKANEVKKELIAKASEHGVEHKDYVKTGVLVTVDLCNFILRNETNPAKSSTISRKTGTNNGVTEREEFNSKESQISEGDISAIIDILEKMSKLEMEIIVYDKSFEKKWPSGNLPIVHEGGKDNSSGEKAQVNSNLIKQWLNTILNFIRSFKKSKKNVDQVSTGTQLIISQASKASEKDNAVPGGGFFNGISNFFRKIGSGVMNTIAGTLKWIKSLFKKKNAEVLDKDGKVVHRFHNEQPA